MDYEGRCHCGKVRFSFRAPEIEAAIRCNCSLCVRHGAILSASWIPKADFTPHRHADDLGVYLWNDKILRNSFCKNCGIFVYVGVGEDRYRANLGCVEGLDSMDLPITRVDGRALPVTEEPAHGRFG